MIDPNDLDTPIFTVEQTSHAIGRSYQLVKKWQNAGIPLIGPESELGSAPGRAGRGLRTRYNLRTVVTLALMAEMTAWGAPADTAYLSAIEFTHLSDGGEAGYAGAKKNPLTDRNPGEIFKRGQTLLVIKNQRESAELVNVHRDAPLEWPDIQASSTLLIDCEKVMARVIGRLDAYEGPT